MDVSQTVIRFQLDEHLTHAIARELTKRGVDVITAGEAGTVGMPDDDLMRHFLAEARVIVTNDKDYLRHHYQGVPHAGIDFFKHGTRSIGEVIDFLGFVADVMSPSEIVGQVEFVFSVGPLSRQDVQ